MSQGSTLRTLEISDPSLSRKRSIVNIGLLIALVSVGVLLYTGLLSAPDLRLFGLAMMASLTVFAIFQCLMLRSVLLRSAFPVTVYQNGIEFPPFFFDKLLKRPSYVAKEDIREAWVSGFHPGRAEQMRGHLVLNLRTVDGKLRDTGARTVEDVEATVLVMETRWGLKVERRDPAIPSITPLAPGMPSKDLMRYCPQCGKAGVMDLAFCPYCGRMFDASKIVTPVRPNEPDHYPSAPEQAWQGPPIAPPWSVNVMGSKDPKKAFKLALVLGFLGIMGMGHAYMGRVWQGLVFLLVGGFFALLSLASWIISLGMTEFSIGVRVFTAGLLSIPYLVLQAIQVMDSPRTPK